jgi:hypothetical protein
MGGGECLWHNGMTGGYASYMEINPKTKTGFGFIYNKGIIPDFVIHKLRSTIPVIA